MYISYKNLVQFDLKRPVEPTEIASRVAFQLLEDSNLATLAHIDVFQDKVSELLENL